MELNWKPCRVVHCYKIENDCAHILGFDGIIRLNKSATVIWTMSNGKNTIYTMLYEFQKMYSNVNDKELLDDIKTIINQLALQGVLIRNWDPLLKDNIIHMEELQ